ncbi:hypothetical protein RO3G_02517 [Lichtheimia corymbifera JMRC:FSU:9682]|uniref:Uncharacterized protein n=1 Tax=Lichtheimia corymbifera JMRC:FSU:9682 TaxID=1263082 RepID=A0A068S1N1_9FUNG|nr:hypothetical protein RO3G_02517 [Lichtheimia corymbifera JMRC:FSU:9682]
MDKHGNDKPMLGGIQSEDDIWTDCLKVILKDSFARESGLEQLNTSAQRSDYTRDKTPITQVKGLRSIAGNVTATKRKRSSFLDHARDRKMQRISSNLANDIARSLSVSGRNPTPTPSSSTDDADVVMSASSSPMRTPISANNNTSSSLSSPSPNPPPPPSSSSSRVYHKMISSRRSSPQPSSSNAMYNGEDPSLLLRRISNGTRLPHHTMDFDEWIKAQAQRQNFNVLEYRQLFEEKQKQLHHYLSEIDGSHDPTKSDAQRFMEIKDNLARILKIANELSGDQSIAFVDIFPEWKAFEGHINKSMAYVQAVEDMKQLSTQSIPRTDDLLADTRRLQSVLSEKMALYGDNLAQNGLEWKAMGLPVDEQLLAMAKGWFYNLCIGLISELDMACSRLRSLVNDMRELMRHPEGEKLMESIACGLEFISSTTSFIGLPSRKLIYGCRVLATVYGQWVSEGLELLQETQLQQRSSGKPSTSSNMMNTSSTRHTRVDIRLMQWMDNMMRILTSLQSLQDEPAVPQQQHGWSDVDSTYAAPPPPYEPVHDNESLTVLENLTSMLVEITVRAMAVIETNCSSSSSSSTASRTFSSSAGGNGGSGPTTISRHANIMTNPIMSTIHMEDTVLSFVDRIVELAGRADVDGWRVQRLHAHLERIEAASCI